MDKKMEMIEISGATGGGQLLRTALALSLCTGTAFEMQHIRAKRKRPGLMRQHLTAVGAAAQIGRAYVEGAQLGATALRFVPGQVQPGRYRFSIGTAGSATLVLQTVLPALWACDAASEITVEGGTHNPLAPSADFLAECYLPALRRFGVETAFALHRHGFFPAGGGCVQLRVAPGAALRPASFLERDPAPRLQATALLASLADAIGQRELQVLAGQLNLGPDALQLRRAPTAQSPANVLMLKIGGEGQHTELFDALGERGVGAEQIAAGLARRVGEYLGADAAVGEYLSDQLLLPMALAGGGEFTTAFVSDHLSSNARLIEKFLPVEIDWVQQGKRCWRVTVNS
ncbi:RNA 3'-terminal phosphate cyclase [Lysobacter enzymogenes]|uniref:RNA 3'-terminal phosphate cyclase n=1 Tax=Lysobacter enzymogenes TaxID=69 RepID=UPI001F52356A|nr:RNA 3'-terminal phosphate cyclase [Lysobacter enzymogenes]UZW61536.1 RNA 3'-terminal phosphate cyclase [Lysobacter enzymogenes]